MVRQSRTWIACDRGQLLSGPRPVPRFERLDGRGTSAAQGHDEGEPPRGPHLGPPRCEQGGFVRGGDEEGGGILARLERHQAHAENPYPRRWEAPLASGSAHPEP